MLFVQPTYYIHILVWAGLHTRAAPKKRKTKIAESFKFNFRYIYDVLSLRNVWFCILNERDIMDNHSKVICIPWPVPGFRKLTKWTDEYWFSFSFVIFICTLLVFLFWMTICLYYLLISWIVCLYITLMVYSVLVTLSLYSSAWILVQQTL